MPTIERVSGITPDQLRSEFVVRRKPVIITDLLDDFPHQDVASVVAELRDLEPVELVAMTEGKSGTSVGEWFEYAKAGVAVPTADNLGSYSAPTLDLPRSYTQQAARFYAFAEQLKTPFDHRVEDVGVGPVVKGTAMAFFGFHNTTLCHVDGWVTETLTAHIAGAKEWFLVAPQNIAPLGPFGAQILVEPFRMTPDQRKSLADTLGGYSFTVRPGETLYWPHQWLHGTFYPEPSFSFVQHFGRDLAVAFMSREVHRCFYRHAILEKLFPEAAVKERYWSEFLQLHDVCKQDYPDAKARFTAVDDALSSLYARLFPEQPIDKLAFKFPRVRDLELAEAVRHYHPELKNLEGQRNGWTKITGQPLFDWWSP